MSVREAGSKWGLDSRTRTRRPPCAIFAAVNRPAAEPPTITTSPSARVARESRSGLATVSDLPSCGALGTGRGPVVPPRVSESSAQPTRARDARVRGGCVSIAKDMRGAKPADRYGGRAKGNGKAGGRSKFLVMSIQAWPFGFEIPAIMLGQIERRSAYLRWQCSHPKSDRRGPHAALEEPCNLTLVTIMLGPLSECAAAGLAALHRRIRSYAPRKECSETAALDLAPQAPQFRRYSGRPLGWRHAADRWPSGTQEGPPSPANCGIGVASVPAAGLREHPDRRYCAEPGNQPAHLFPLFSQQRCGIARSGSARICAAGRESESRTVRQSHDGAAPPAIL